MNRHLFILYLLLSVFFSFCCTNSSSDSKTARDLHIGNTTEKELQLSDNIYQLPDKPFKVDIGKALKSARQINLSEYCDSIEYVPIETRDDLFMADITINSFMLRNNLIYYKGRWGVGSRIFDINGKFVSDKIGVNGRGHGEFYMLSNLCLNEYTSELIGTDTDKIFVYDTLGNFKRSIPHKNTNTRNGIMHNYFYPLGQYYVLHSKNHGSKEYYLTFLDSKANIISSKKIGKMPDGLPLNSNPTLNLSLQNGLLHVMDIMSDSVFTYNRNLERRCSYILDYGKYKPDIQTTMNDQFCLVNQIIENKRLALLICKVQQKTLPYMLHTNNLVYLIYDKLNGTCRVLPPDKNRKWFAFNNDIDNGLPFNPVMIKGNKMYQFVDAYNFIKYSKSCSSQKVKEIAATLTEDSNHVMIVAHFTGPEE